ncbi:MAG TPA: hypothetical protein VIY48_09975 [Candidatus Paceibacterota bacterium]
MTRFLTDEEAEQGGAAYWYQCLMALHELQFNGVPTYGAGHYENYGKPDQKFIPREEWQTKWNEDVRTYIMEAFWDFYKKCQTPTPEWKMTIEMVARGVAMWTSWDEDEQVHHDKDDVLCLNVNDMFCWGCADAEQVRETEIAEVYAAWKADPGWGLVKWAARKRNLQPQRPVIELMKKHGSWDDVMEGLGKNRE